VRVPHTATGVHAMIHLLRYSVSAQALAV